jgi:hypothetical protein
MNSGWTAYYDDRGFIVDSWPSRSAVTRRSLPGADDPYHSNNVYPAAGPHNNNPDAFGPNDILTTDDTRRGRWMHGGGTGLPDPSAPRQGWKPTHGCTRMQNEDIQELVGLVRAAKKRDQRRAIPYDRIRDEPYQYNFPRMDWGP